MNTSAVIQGLSKLLEHRSRLATCVLLNTQDRMSFSALKSHLKETDGNLGAQLRRLEEANYIAVEKSYDGRKPVSWYTLTEHGKRHLKTHLEALQVFVESGLSI